jgi:hypothetical protein
MSAFMRAQMHPPCMKLSVRCSAQQAERSPAETLSALLQAPATSRWQAPAGVPAPPGAPAHPGPPASAEPNAAAPLEQDGSDTDTDSEVGPRPVPGGVGIDSGAAGLHARARATPCCVSSMRRAAMQGT